jgi:hypothetical protein
MVSVHSGIRCALVPHRKRRPGDGVPETLYATSNDLHVLYQATFAYWQIGGVGLPQGWAHRGIQITRFGMTPADRVARSHQRLYAPCGCGSQLRSAGNPVAADRLPPEGRGWFRVTAGGADAAPMLEARSSHHTALWAHWLQY